ncbi:hypothetical protein CCHL11_05501 [Colletotrichum chlorophyti]|uniref:MARVEL domain-containing protein n=1 Tax=Colletotrichum chlorophyti TaxID=708187 RepID=A0A1Q8RBG4_9PEZI|nr:hypothetical protein CCHL11_05501 [Colletotrichum chlorophyti]
MLSFISMGVWVAQGIMAIVVLGLTVDLIMGQEAGNSRHAPTTTRYGTFTGGFGLAIAILGLGSVFIEAIPALIVLAADALSGLLLLGGGIAFAIGLHGVTCTPRNQSDADRLQKNPLLNGGVDILARCRKAKTVQSMQFVTFGLVLATIVLLFLAWKNSRSAGRGSSYA